MTTDNVIKAKLPTKRAKLQRTTGQQQQHDRDPAHAAVNQTQQLAQQRQMQRGTQVQQQDHGHQDHQCYPQKMVQLVGHRVVDEQPVVHKYAA